MPKMNPTRTYLASLVVCTLYRYSKRVNKHTKLDFVRKHAWHPCNPIRNHTFVKLFTKFRFKPLILGKTFQKLEVKSQGFLLNKTFLIKHTLQSIA